MVTTTMATTRASTDSDPAAWNLAVATGLIRVVAGVLLWRRPATLIRLAGGSADDSVLRALFRYFAVRDLALGIATLAATRPGGDVPRVVTLQAVADTVDGAVVGGLVATGRLDRLRGIGAAGLAAGTAVVEYAAAWQLRRSHR